MIGETVRSILTVGGSKTRHESRDNRGADERRSEPESKLFSCPECDAVYIALEKELCSTCREELTEVSPTLTKG